MTFAPANSGQDACATKEENYEAGFEIREFRRII
jgi:hypothetical protein